MEVVAEDEQQFLSRQQQYLAQGLPPSQGQGGPMPPGVQKTPDRKVVGSPGVQGSPKKVRAANVKLVEVSYVFRAWPAIPRLVAK